MIVKPALAAMLASGLIVPETQKLVLPKPAIVKAENLEFTRHILLGMPLTMGMLAAKNRTPVTATYTGAITSTTNALSYSLTLPIGTASADRYIVVAIFIPSGGVPSGVTIDGVAAVTSTTGIYISASPVTTGTTTTVAVTCQTTADQCLMYGYSLVGSRPVTRNTAFNLTLNGTMTVNTIAGGCVIAGTRTNANAATTSWSVLTARNTQSLESTNTYSTASENYTTFQTIVIDDNWSAGTSQVRAAASYGPA